VLGSGRQGEVLGGLQRSWLWRGNVPADVVGASPALEIRRWLVVGRQEQGNLAPFLWRGNVPLAEQPELYRRAILVREELYDRDPLRGWLHRGNAPGDFLPPQETIRRWAINALEPNQREGIRAFLWAGNVPIAVQPELYRRIVQGPRPESFEWLQPSVLRAGNQPDDVIVIPNPRLPAMQLFVLP
jgi:hypothetical protein